jgi:hypothetical protein
LDVIKHISRAYEVSLRQFIASNIPQLEVWRETEFIKDKRPRPVYPNNSINLISYCGKEATISAADFKYRLWCQGVTTHASAAA